MYYRSIDNQLTMTDRVKLALLWAQEQADFVKVDIDSVLENTCNAVAQLTDKEVEEFLA